MFLLAIRSQVHELVQAKHSLQTKLRNVEDAIAAITAENQSLHSSLRSTAAVPLAKTITEAHPWQGEVLFTELLTEV